MLEKEMRFAMHFLGIYSLNFGGCIFGTISDLLDFFFETPGSIHFQNDAKLLECDGFAFCREFFPQVQRHFFPHGGWKCPSKEICIFRSFGGNEHLYKNSQPEKHREERVEYPRKGNDHITCPTKKIEKVWKIICYLKSAFKKGDGDLLVFRRVSFCPRNRWVSMIFPTKDPHEASTSNSARKNPVTFFWVVPWNFRDPTPPDPNWKSWSLQPNDRGRGKRLLTNGIASMRWWCFWTQKLDPREVDFWPPTLSPIMVQWRKLSP